MMTTTQRKAAATAFTHIMENVLGCAADHPLRKALAKEGYTTMMDIPMLDYDTINGFTYDKSDSEKDVELPKFHKALLVCLIKFKLWRDAEGDPVVGKWEKVTKDEFDDFRTGPNFVNSSRFDGTPTAKPHATTGSSAASTSTSLKYSPAELFKRGIKRDPNAFPIHSRTKDFKLHGIVLL